MVSFWPWKTDDSASFERTLAALSERIKKANVKQDRLRTTSRRYKALWTLYSSLSYLVSTLVLVLVTGWDRWGAFEYTAIAGAPVVIYCVRAALNWLYEYRLSTNQAYLDGLNQQRDDAIEKFKNATKFNSTQQILEKYGAAPKQPATPRDSPASSAKKKSRTSEAARGATPQRTGLPPPPTANIRRTPEAVHGGAYQHHHNESMPQTPIQSQWPHGSTSSPDISASFAPNAFTAAVSSSTPQYIDGSQRNWYDRIFDVLLGEDETRASNRLALICQHCRLVNGQAPPGVKTMKDMGRWRCAECRGWNGVEDEIQKVLASAKDESSDATETKQRMHSKEEVAAAEGLADDSGPAREAEPAEDASEMVSRDVDDGTSEDDAAEEEPPARSTRSRKKLSEEDT